MVTSKPPKTKPSAAKKLTEEKTKPAVPSERSENSKTVEKSVEATASEKLKSPPASPPIVSDKVDQGSEPQNQARSRLLGGGVSLQTPRLDSVTSGPPKHKSEDTVTSSVEKNIDQKDVSLEAKCSEMLMNYKKKYAIGAAATGLATQVNFILFVFCINAKSCLEGRSAASHRGRYCSLRFLLANFSCMYRTIEGLVEGRRTLQGIQSCLLIHCHFNLKRFH